MTKRVQVLLSEEERERFRHQAKAQGMSLSQWLRRAGLEQLHRSDSDAEWTADDLQQFFDQVDKSEKDKTPEPDWEEHLATIDDSRLSGLPKP